MDNEAEFKAHIATCPQCRQSFPFDPCVIGDALLTRRFQKASLVTYYIVWTKDFGFWLGWNNHWVEKKEDAQPFATFAEAVQASEGYDVIIKTVEK